MSIMLIVIYIFPRLYAWEQIHAENIGHVCAALSRTGGISYKIHDNFLRKDAHGTGRGKFFF